eukprot:TRINITY_DN19765_c0_g1_i1.p1 TRINITY_DN19765_c0_g1~~TRINITY_DN19765_c0_g1_i1.p1  ORF type:complete len:461 (+),score=158.11 TRINITY_DN19765_c0_g1_i1:121-1503(+)
MAHGNGAKKAKSAKQPAQANAPGAEGAAGSPAPLTKSALKRMRLRAQKEAAEGGAPPAAPAPDASPPADPVSEASPPAAPASADTAPTPPPSDGATPRPASASETPSPAASSAASPLPGEEGAPAPFVFELNAKPTGYQLRGMMNLGNTCYQNAVVQALVASPPFLNLMKALPKNVKSPVLKELRHVIHGFRPGGVAGPIDARQLLHVMATRFKAAARGNHEDAGEFLISLLCSVEEELGVLCGLAAGGNKKKKAKKEGWETATKSGKSLGVEHATGAVAEKNPVNAIFGGQLSSRLATKNQKPSVTNQPFTGILPIDIINDRCGSVEACLQDYTAPQEVDNLTTGTAATKQTRFSRLPPILVLQLNRWGEEAGKLSKRLVVNPVLTIHPSATSDSRRCEYSLQAAVCHKGATKHSGHYTAVVRKSGKWALADDARIAEIPGVDAAAADPYLLFYAKAGR